jgi:hypothetical protein
MELMVWIYKLIVAGSWIFLVAGLICLGMFVRYLFKRKGS